MFTDILSVIGLIAIGGLSGSVAAYISAETVRADKDKKIRELKEKIEKLESESESRNVEVIEITDNRPQAPHNYFTPF